MIPIAIAINARAVKGVGSRALISWVDLPVRLFRLTRHHLVVGGRRVWIRGGAALWKKVNILNLVINIMVDDLISFIAMLKYNIKISLKSSKCRKENH